MTINTDTTDSHENLFDIDNMIHFRVFGIGSETLEAVRQISSQFSRDTTAESVSPSNPPSPTPHDKMAIFLISQPSKETEALVRSFKEANVLTILICTSESDIDTGAYDSMTIVALPEFAGVVKTLLDTIILPGYVNLDFYDIYTILHDSGRFITTNAIGTGDDRMQKAITAIRTVINNDSDFSSLMFNIAISCLNESNKMALSEIEPLSKLVSDFDTSTEVVWGARFDDSVPDGCVAISVIATPRT